MHETLADDICTFILNLISPNKNFDKSREQILKLMLILWERCFQISRSRFYIFKHFFV